MIYLFVITYLVIIILIVIFNEQLQCEQDELKKELSSEIRGNFLTIQACNEMIRILSDKQKELEKRTTNIEEFGNIYPKE